MQADLIIVGAGMVGSALALALEHSGLEILVVDGGPLSVKPFAAEGAFEPRVSALSAASGELTLVPGSMAGPSFHVIGRGSVEALDSCAHGAGRSMSRSEARREITPASLRRQMKGVTFDERGENALVEEAPEAYKDPRAVMRAQQDLVKTVRQLKPLINYKAP